MDFSNILSRPIAFFGKKKVWRAEGDDLALFKRHQDHIRNLLDNSCVPESTHFLWIGLYRIGTNQDEAKAFVVVSCSDKEIRSLAKAFLSSCPIFLQGGALSQFKVISKATPPEAACEPQLTMETCSEGDGDECSSLQAPSPPNRNSDPTGDHDTTVIRFSPSRTGDNYLCRHIQAISNSEEGLLNSQFSTAGPLIWLDGCSYQLTVQHVVNFENKDIDVALENGNGNDDDWDDDDDDTDGDDDNCSFDEDVAAWNISAPRSVSPSNSSAEKSDDELSSASSSNAIPMPSDEHHGETDKGTSSISETFSDLENSTLSCSGNSDSGGFCHLSIEGLSSSLQTCNGSSITSCPASAEVDYLLIPTQIYPDKDKDTHDRAERVQLSDTFNVHDNTETRPVILATESLGYVEGTLFPASALLRRPGYKNFRNFFCIESSKAMFKGTSGSAVFDVQTGLLTGFIVLGCPGSSTWYMVPISDVLDDLKRRLGVSARCQISLNVSAAMGARYQTDNFAAAEATKLYKTCSPCKDETNVQPSKDEKREIGEGKIRPSVSPHTMFHDIKRVSQVVRDPTLEWFADGVPKDKLCKSFDCSTVSSEYRHPKEGDSELSKIWSSNGNELLSSMESMAGRLGRLRGKDSPQPTAWIDAQSELSRDFYPPYSAGDGLNSRELLELLQRKDNSHTYFNNANHRRIYISNPDYASISALIRSAPRSDYHGLHELFSNYITETPKPSINFKASFLTIIYPTILRNGAECLSFLYEATAHDDQFPQQDKRGLREAVFSFVIMGPSEEHSTAYSFDEYNFDEEDLHNDSLDDEEHIDEAYVYKDHQAGNDGVSIMIKPTTKRTMSPRLYALEALTDQLNEIANYHAEIWQIFEVSLDHYVSYIL
ncbi:hypothetical protein F53441_12160 [Fusarium austroafricanum]|uniref:Uncharacterized protein n=1 Tax=Fusarium austroafricanum TaxID=2364996 RepID=A0A8H4NQW4_9HYPO|nr:hypothetical protein F53441_12160 [Fusarium austroafricanum]